MGKRPVVEIYPRRYYTVGEWSCYWVITKKGAHPKVYDKQSGEYSHMSNCSTEEKVVERYKLGAPEPCDANGNLIG